MQSVYSTAPSKWDDMINGNESVLHNLNSSRTGASSLVKIFSHTQDTFSSHLVGGSYHLHLIESTWPNSHWQDEHKPENENWR